MPSGPVPGGAAGPLVVISPHLDDAVFGCGELLSLRKGGVVVTVCASGPQPIVEPTPWDASSGFRAGDDVIAARRREDLAALAHLGATPRWLDYWDRQYGRTATVEQVRASLADEIRQLAPATVAIPLGLWHGDHRLVHDAAVPLVREFADITWLAYEDAIYRRLADGGLGERLQLLPRAAGVQARRTAHRPFHASLPKRRAVGCYGSQIAALQQPGQPGHADALAPEGLWRLVPGS